MTTIKAKRDSVGLYRGKCYCEGDEFTVYWREGVAEIRCNDPSGERHFLCVDVGVEKTRNVRTEQDLHWMEDFEVLPDVIEHDPHETDEKPDLTPAPEGVEFAMRVFLRCDAAGLSHVLNFPGNRYHPPVVEGGVDVAELIDSLHPDEGRFLKAAGEWRVMTRPEITRYKARMARAAEEIHAARGPAGFNRRQ